jgi:thioredoxin reductase (NADPH)
MKKYQVIIIGSGPAAYTAGIYTARANLFTLILEGKNPGGQLMTTTTIENYPGFESIDGFDLIDNMKKQAVKNGCETIGNQVIKIEKHSDYFIIMDHTDNLYKCKGIILATGAYPNKLNFKNSDKYWNHGISSCAVCDGALPIFRKQTIVVVGGGDSAMEEALFLSRFASKVIILVRSNKLRASKAMIKKVELNDKIKIRFNNEVIEANGDIEGNLESIIIVDNSTEEKKKIHCAGLFYAIGHTPNSEIVKDIVKLKSNNYIEKVNGSTKTNVPGIFAAGDVSDDIYRQAITAAASGCIAALDLSKYMESIIKK